MLPELLHAPCRAIVTIEHNTIRTWCASTGRGATIQQSGELVPCSSECLGGV